MCCIMKPLCVLGFLNRVKDYATTVSSRVGEVVSQVMVTLLSGDMYDPSITP